MTAHIVHLGKGQVAVRGGHVEFADPTLSVPKRVYKASQTPATRFLAMEAQESRGHALARFSRALRYRPGSILDMASDQCRFIELDDGICCGRKIADELNGAWCQKHRQVVYPGARLKPFSQRNDPCTESSAKSLARIGVHAG